MSCRAPDECYCDDCIVVPERDTKRVSLVHRDFHESTLAKRDADIARLKAQVLDLERQLGAGSLCVAQHRMDVGGELDAKLRSNSPRYRPITANEDGKDVDLGVVLGVLVHTDEKNAVWRFYRQPDVRIERIYGPWDFSNAVHAIEEKSTKVMDIAPAYADCIRAEAVLDRVTSAEEICRVNAAILKRWSESALVKIKREAWRLVDSNLLG